MRTSIASLEQVVINVLIFFLLKKAYRNRVNRLEKRVLAARGVVPLIYGEAPPERGTFFSLQVYKGVEVSLVDLKYMNKGYGNLSLQFVKGP